MSLRENMQSLYKTFGKDHDENFEATKAALLQLRKEPDSKENKAIMKECITALIELKQKYQHTNQTEKQIHQTIDVKNAVSTLSYSECRIMIHIINELKDHNEAIIVTSQIADKAGITRSVAVNALRKLQSAKIVEYQSLGAKGTFVKVINPAIYKEAEHVSIIHFRK